MGPPGFLTTNREPKRAHLRVPAFKNTTKIQREDTQRGKKRTNFAAGDGNKRAKFWAVQGKGGPGEGRSRGRAVQGKGGPNQTLKPTPTHETPLYRETVPTPLRQHTTQHNTTHHTTNQTRFGQSRFGQSRFWPKSVWPKSVLAKVGFGQSRFGQSRFWPKSAIPLKH